MQVTHPITSDSTHALTPMKLIMRKRTKLKVLLQFHPSGTNTRFLPLFSNPTKLSKTSFSIDSFWRWLPRMASSSYPNPFARPKNSIVTFKNFFTTSFHELSEFSNKTQLINYPHLPGSHQNKLIINKVYWNYVQSSKLSTFLARNENWVDVEAGSPKYMDDEFLVINFYRFVLIENPEEEVNKHLTFMQGRDIHGRIYINEQGINAQYSGPSKDVLAYIEWVKEDRRFSEILVQITPALDGHAFPKLKLRYKPSLVQLEEGISHLPLLDPSMRATPLTPSQWRSKLKAVNNIQNSSNVAEEKSCILLDVRNGYEWDVGHFEGAQRPDVDCFRSTSFGLSESEVITSDPLANIDKEKTDILMYCTGGIRCDVYSTILRQRGFKRLYTLKGGVSHYLENEGSDGWAGNLFVFDGRLSLPPSTFKPEINDEEGTNQQEMAYSFAKCYVCSSQVSELRHRNCANLDCNLLFLCCMKCVNDLRGCCCINCISAPRLRPMLIGQGRYQKWHKYRDVELPSK